MVVCGISLSLLIITATTADTTIDMHSKMGVPLTSSKIPVKHIAPATATKKVTSNTTWNILGFVFSDKMRAVINIAANKIGIENKMKISVPGRKRKS